MVRVLGMCLILAAFGASAAESAGKPVYFRTSARLSLDAQGVPQQVLLDGKLPAVVRSSIEQRVMQWRFEPARLDGEPRSGITTVFLSACAVPDAHGSGLRLAVDYDWNGPGYANGLPVVMPPRYPIDAAKSDKSGSFRVVMEIQPDGHARIETIEPMKGQLRYFEKTLRDWVAALRYIPEEVDGKPVASRVAMPVTFSTGDSGASFKDEMRARQNSPECVAAKAAHPGDDAPRPVVLDSPFKPITTS